MGHLFIQMNVREGNHLNGTDVLSFSLRLKKDEILYILSSGFVLIHTRTPPLHLRLIFFSVCTATVMEGSP